MSIHMAVVRSGRVRIAATSFRVLHMLMSHSGFTAIVNKQLSSKYETLVDNASSLIEVLPWGKDYEVDVFRKPDFTALEVVSFATGGVPFSFSRLVYFVTSPF